jgi:hypothetical protein
VQVSQIGVSADKDCYRQTKLTDFALRRIILGDLRALEKVSNTLPKV